MLAVGATCALLQSSDSFWALHDKLFENQANITSDNVQSKIREYVSLEKTIDLSAFDKCISNSLSLGLVYRDTQLAASNHVNATPSVFINGHKVAGVKDAVELQGLIEQAKAGALHHTSNGENT